MEEVERRSVRRFGGSRRGFGRLAVASAIWTDARPSFRPTTRPVPAGPTESPRTDRHRPEPSVTGAEEVAHATSSGHRAEGSRLTSGRVRRLLLPRLRGRTRPIRLPHAGKGLLLPLLRNATDAFIGH